MRHNNIFNQTLNKMADGLLFNNVQINFDIKFFRRLNWIFFISIVGMIIYMFNVKSHVQDLNFEKKQLKSQIYNEKTKMSLLKAEYAYLSSPARLKILADKYLTKMGEVKSVQIAMYDQTKGVDTKRFVPNKSRNTWRYKRSDIITASKRMKK